MKLFSGSLSRLSLVAAVCCLSPAAQARVVRIEVLARAPIEGTGAGHAIPAYEKIQGRVYFAVDPKNAYNRPIVDLDKAERDAHGEVEFSADLFLLRPVEAGNGALLLEIPNRGGKGIVSLIEGGKADPTNESETGDGWLLKQGYTLASLGWQWDAVEGPGRLRLYAPIAHGKNGAHITGLLRDDFTLSKSKTELPLGHVMGEGLGGTEYAVAAPDDARNVLTVRDTPHGARTVIPRSGMEFCAYGRWKAHTKRPLFHAEIRFRSGQDL